tara:strand:- start:499 stop:612 length:114 start_codon:yes stop_codon:yes gene_type:complete
MILDCREDRSMKRAIDWNRRVMEAKLISFNQLDKVEE